MVLPSSNHCELAPLGQGHDRAIHNVCRLGSSLHDKYSPASAYVRGPRELSEVSAARQQSHI